MNFQETDVKQMAVKDSLVRIMELVRKELMAISASAKMDFMEPTVNITMVFQVSVTIFENPYTAHMIIFSVKSKMYN